MPSGRARVRGGARADRMTRMPRRMSHWLLPIVAVAAIAVYLAFDLGQILSLDSLKAQQLSIAAWRDSNPVAAALVFFAAYVAVTAVSLPGAAVMTLAAGAIFGLLWGTVIVSFASSLGATLAFLATRFLLNEWVQRRLGNRLEAINAGVEKDGAFYLFSLRLVPVFPFFAVNLLMGLTRIRVSTFYWVSQVGMLAGTVVYVNAGTQLAAIESLETILSPTLILSFALLGLLPLLGRWLVAALHRGRHAHAPPPAAAVEPEK